MISLLYYQYQQPLTAYNDKTNLVIRYVCVDKYMTYSCCKRRYQT